MYYDMSGFDFDIRDVVRVLNLRIKRKTGTSYDTDCPFCGNTKGKLNINIKKNVFRCNYCGEHGGMLDLYAKFHGVSLPEANKQIREALSHGQYREDYQTSKDPIDPPPVENSELAAEDVIDNTYSAMLSKLTLNQSHRDSLKKRGLSDRQIEEQRYRSVPVFGFKNLTQKLMDQGCTVEGVPGFYEDREGRWSINFSAKNSGILIPVVSVQGYVQGFQIRLDHVSEDRKYIWLSSVNKDKGVSSGSPVHVIGARDAKRVYVTEGALKGSIAHYMTGETFVCVAGVNQYRNLKPVLEELCGYGLETVIEAYDMDKRLKTTCNRHYTKCSACQVTGNPAECPYKTEKRRIIQSGCRKVGEICRELSLEIRTSVWDTDKNGDWNGNIKGIDDLQYAIRTGRI